MGGMTAKRVVLVVTCVVVAGLAVVFGVVQWDRANRIAVVVSALAAVAAVGVAVWAALPSRTGTTVTADGTGDAVAGKGGTANTGVKVSATGLPNRVEAKRTGKADASWGGDANTGIDLT